MEFIQNNTVDHFLESGSLKAIVLDVDRWVHNVVVYGRQHARQENLGYVKLSA